MNFMIKYLTKDFFILASYFILSLIFYPIIYIYNNQYYFQQEDFIKYLESPLTIILLAILLVYFTFLILRKIDWQKYFKPIIIGFLLISIILISLPVVSSSDIYQYIAHAKIYNHYEQNPYTATPNQFSDDFLMNKISDQKMAAVYGPVWTLTSIGLNKISGSNLELNIILLKLLNFIFIILTALLIFKIAKPDKKYLALMFFILNPIILYEFLLNGHNDIVMIFFLVLIPYFFKSKKYFWILPAITISILIKPITIIVLPIILVYLVKRTKLNHVIYSAILSAAIFVLSWLPFYQGAETFKGFETMAEQANHFLFYFAKLASFDLSYFRTGLFILFSLIYLIILLYIIQIKRHNFISFILLTFTLYLLIASFWLKPWYLALLIPLIAVKIPNNKLVYGLNIFYLLIIIYGFLLDNLLI